MLCCVHYHLFDAFELWYCLAAAAARHCLLDVTHVYAMMAVCQSVGANCTVREAAGQSIAQTCLS